MRGAASSIPGALLLGNGGRCFECGHEHGSSDRCVSVGISEELLGEIAAVAASSMSRFRFSAPSLPPSPEALPVVSPDGGTVATGAWALRCEELVPGLVEHIVGHNGQSEDGAAAPSAREARRAVDASRVIESDAAQPVAAKPIAATAPG